MLTVFYDGQCALCHFFVRYLVARDEAGTRFRFAPLGSKLFRKMISEDAIAKLPDSVVVVDEAGVVHTKSEGVALALSKTNGFSAFLSRLIRVLPSGLSNIGYDCIAGIRRSLFRKPQSACPVISSDLQKRFFMD